MKDFIKPPERMLKILNSANGKEHPLKQEYFYQVASNLPMGKSAELVTCLEELQLNAQEHGSPPTKLWYQVESDILYCAVEDQGIGICKKLLPVINLISKGKISCGAILRLSLEEGITSTGVEGRGQGLHYVSQYIRAVGGELFIASNSGILHLRTLVDNKVESTTDEIEERKGTLVLLAIPK